MIPSFLKNRPFLPIATERLILRPLEAHDAAAMTLLASDIRVAERLNRIPHPYSLDDAKAYIAYANAGLKKGTHVCLAIVRRVDHTFLGVIGLEEELGYWIGHRFWEQGYGKEAVHSFMHFCFFALNQKEIEAKALMANLASCRILEGLGFQNLGIVRITSLAYQGERPAQKYFLSRKDYIEHYNSILRPHVWVVAAALVNDRKELLMAERPHGVRMAGVWELPGGKMEPGETPEQTLIRELHEELHIKVDKEDLEPFSFVSYRYDTFHLIMPIYLCRNWQGTPHGAEGQRISWVTYRDLAHMPLPAADIISTHQLADKLKEKNVWA